MTPRAISGNTLLCLIIGDPIAHSLTPAMHNSAYDAANLNYCMAAAKVSRDDLSKAVGGIRALSIRGVAVTMPHKVSICPMLDALDPVAKTIGAVNTVVNAEGSLTGYNTDWLGIIRPLEKRMTLSGAHIAVLGAGGAAQAAVYACAQSGANVTIFNRTSSKAQLLANRHTAHWEELTASPDMSRFDVIINTTSVGMGDLKGRSPIPGAVFKEHQIIFETIYSPRETQLVKDGLLQGCSIITGEEMFLEQGAAQFELHTGRQAPRLAMKSLLDANAVKTT